MSGSFLSILALGFILGIKHATEPDHIIAVSTIASRTKKLSRSSMTGIFWGLGHSATLLVVGMIVIGLKQQISEQTAAFLEFFVGIMLVYLGVNGVRLSRKQKVHEHGGTKHFHAKSFAIGSIHGLAGSAAMVLLTLTRVNTTMEAFQFILIFGVGTIAGMLLFTTALGLPFIWAASRHSLQSSVAVMASALSLLYGLYYMYSIAF
ncbi:MULTISPECIES: HoxN/HupN/NixA family nickel/cobalt transporter [Bacillaceae]|jgi:sulfite exporter TauE/SafE|uniref:HoxN/HupN/NixA family nickel/cobalt transporter n=1 Tax=Bacillaceae TaxID=186817 RepID=UPI00101CDAF6|nr:urease accessory protein UreH [Ectobacillus funiculus]